ncbi:MAG TPA: DJ-1/PfpI family protein [Steroidobacteraceae bacterium]|nr:DJ-1/PfpI family protein [Steroidobacteraceae bacterium]
MTTLTTRLESGESFKVVMLLYPGVTQLDLTGPAEVFGRVRGVSVDLAWKNTEPVTAAAITPPGMRFVPSVSFAEVERADLLCVPGGPGHLEMLADDEVLGFLRRIATTARYITSVCTGSLLLGAAGLLEGYRAATHWNSMQFLDRFGAIPVEQRVVIDRNRITGGGVTAGIDFGLHVIRELWGLRSAEMAQLTIEYDPQPPTTSGSPRTASPELVARAQQVMAAYTTRQRAFIDAALARRSRDADG